MTSSDASKVSITSEIVQQLYKMMTPKEILYKNKCISADLGVCIRSCLNIIIFIKVFHGCLLVSLTIIARGGPTNLHGKAGAIAF